MPESFVLEELRAIREQLRFIAEQIRLLLIYEVDPGVAALPEDEAETKGRLQADDDVVRQHHRAVLTMPTRRGEPGSKITQGVSGAKADDLR
jgi:hypothetical protein